MGNRAIICFESKSNQPDAVNGREVEGFAIYLHWNGGPESVYAFLDVLNERMETRGGDMGYGAARMVEIIGRFKGGNTALGLLPINGQARALIAHRYQRASDVISHGDNGIYVVGYEDGRYVITGRMTYDSAGSERWLTREEAGREERDARKHDYWLPAEDGKPKVTIVEHVRYRAHMGMGGVRTNPFTNKVEPIECGEYGDESEAAMVKAIIAARSPAPAKPKRSKRKVA